MYHSALLFSLRLSILSCLLATSVSFSMILEAAEFAVTEVIIITGTKTHDIISADPMHVDHSGSDNAE